MTDQARSHDPFTVMAIAAIVGVVSTQLHEAVGHGGACLALGAHVSEWGAFYVNCDTGHAPPMVGRLVAAAGSTMNLLTALVAFAVLRATPPSRPRAWFFWWLMFAVGGFEWAGYYFFSGISGLGDWGASPDGVFNRVPGWTVWRILLAVGGFALYWAWAIVAMRRLTAVTGADADGARRARNLSWLAYLTIGGVAVAIGLMNPVGLFVLLASAVASSFGGSSGLMWGPFNIRPGAAAARPFDIARSWLWIGAGVVLVLAEGLILGPTLHF